MATLLIEFATRPLSVFDFRDRVDFEMREHSKNKTYKLPRGGNCCLLHRDPELGTAFGGSERKSATIDAGRC
ncbi:MAG: hypothetical protein WCQ57_01425 [Verrucomicrobiota bacterium]